MAYLFLLLAIGTEVLGTSLLRATEGFTRLGPTLACLVGYALSFVFLAQTVRSLPIGVVYAVWSGLGTAAIVAIGAAFLDEPLSLVKVLGVGLIIAGVVMLQIGGVH